MLELRSGLRDGRRWPKTEIGRMFNVSRERIRQVEAQGLRRVRLANHTPED